ncbi:hypothetical protein BpHYR1_030362 [Brachionus plicatilis]|uniref:Uncharacterized protein n=1 Tax=Brachionus plicatilis TaxID=10195 RepID=A0A3M7RBZ1_BRAPC|nr:hypothetical protein BpHYR1_030362 [Brachionus plicatilis]
MVQKFHKHCSGLSVQPAQSFQTGHITLQFLDIKLARINCVQIATAKGKEPMSSECLYSNE